MEFHSLQFLVFFLLVFISFWYLNNKGKRNLTNLLIVIASYTFYGFWDWRFLSLILLSSVVDFTLGAYIAGARSSLSRKIGLWTSVIVNLSILGYFKYCDFFIESFNDLYVLFTGKPSNIYLLNIILPPGISFYTFQTLSYTIDIYRNKTKPTKDILAFFSFVSFFPQLVAGPIERAEKLLPQFLVIKKTNIDDIKDGLRRVLWGIFKKVVIADNCAFHANIIFEDYTNQPASTLILGAVLFSFQIYCDFSAYSDIAIGSAKMLGFHLMENFKMPYFSRSITEFWKRWHISLTSWFRDYVYIPLGGNRVSRVRNVLNIGIVFLISGFWHGANWTFIFWGLIHFMIYLPYVLRKKNKSNEKTKIQIKQFPQILMTFSIVTFAWIFFRSASITSAFEYIHGILDYNTIFSLPTLGKSGVIYVLIILLVEWISKNMIHPLEALKGKPFVIRWGVYYLLAAFIFYFSGQEQQFIYFQF